MKVLYSDKRNVDFDGPVDSDDEKNQELIKWFKSNFRPDCVEIVEREEIRTIRLGDSDKSRWPKRWSRNERATLCDVYKTTEQIAEELGRTWLSVNPKRGGYIGDFLLYTARRNIKLTKENIRRYIREYLEYKENIKREEKEQREELNLKRRRLEKKKNRLEKTLERQSWTKSSFPKTTGIDEAINNTQKELDEVKKKLEEFD